MTYVFENRETGRQIERQYSIREDIPVIVFEDGVPFHRVFTPSPIHFHGEWSTTSGQDSITRWQRENLRRD